MGPRVPLKVLFVVPYAPTGIRTRPLNLIRALGAEGHDVTVATLWTSERERAAIGELEADGIRVVAEHLPPGRSAWNCVAALAGTEPLQAHYSWSPRLASRLRRLIDQTAYDVVHVEHLRGVRYGLMAADLVRHRTPRPALVWDSVDCISLLFRRAAVESQVARARLAARLELGRTERYEGRVAAAFDRVVVTSDEDRQALLALVQSGKGTLPDTHVQVVPNGVDLEYFSPVSEPREPMTIVVTGKMSYHANVTAARWLVEEVMPGVWAAAPAARLWIVGQDPAREVQALGATWPDPPGPGASMPASRVIVTGTVPDIRPYLRRATVAVAPIRYGVGIQNKVLEAMACGTPVVATPQAVAGVPTRSGSELVVASTAGEFAQAIVSLLGDRGTCDRLSRASRAFAERQHDWRRAGAALTDIYRHARD
ncbi:MAG: glycosyltransferase [Acidobacteria bacterium]|nr:glycosyltransferase [Acidobacteriota bacterium]